MPQPLTGLIASLSRQLGLDPQAVFAVARGEGGLRYGAVGDGGHAFGPFQMNDAGGVLTGRFGSSQARARYANSPAGLREALTAMSKVAKGRTGEDAVRQIVSRYERPADIPKSIAAAIARLGTSGASGTPRGGSTPVPGNMGSNPIASTSISQGLMDGTDLLDLLLSQKRPGDVVSPSKPRVAPMGTPVPPEGRYGVEELFYDPLGGFDAGKPTGPIGGHSDHVHVSESNPADMLKIIRLAQSMGLAVRENPWVDPVEPVHTKGSFHYRTQKFRGKKMGEGADVSGPAAKMAAFYRALAPKKR